MKTLFAPVKLSIVAGLVLTAGASLLIGTAKPAVAGTSISFSISTDDFTLGYRICPDGGYRYWTPAYYDSRDRRHEGCFTGQEVYRPNFSDQRGRGNDYVESDRVSTTYHDSDRGGNDWGRNDGARDNQRGNWAGDRNDNHSGDRDRGHSDHDGYDNNHGDNDFRGR